MAGVTDKQLFLCKRYMQYHMEVLEQEQEQEAKTERLEMLLLFICRGAVFNSAKFPGFLLEFPARTENCHPMIGYGDRLARFWVARTLPAFSHPDLEGSEPPQFHGFFRQDGFFDFVKKTIYQGVDFFSADRGTLIQGVYQLSFSDFS